jgi:hypothetical protein
MNVSLSPSSGPQAIPHVTHVCWQRVPSLPAQPMPAPHSMASQGAQQQQHSRAPGTSWHNSGTSRSEPDRRRHHQRLLPSPWHCAKSKRHNSCCTLVQVLCYSKYLCPPHFRQCHQLQLQAAGLGGGLSPLLRDANPPTHGHFTLPACFCTWMTHKAATVHLASSNASTWSRPGSPCRWLNHSPAAAGEAQLLSTACYCQQRAGRPTVSCAKARVLIQGNPKSHPIPPSQLIIPACMLLTHV